jgi:predicted DCC family thiol-disulfide oxidoreductase YuxK
VLALPAQTPGLRDRYGLTRQDTDRSAWAFDSAGGRYEGAAAINRALAELPRWRRLAGVYAVPGLRLAEDGIYRVVAATRHRLSALTRTAPECDDPQVECEEA